MDEYTPDSPQELERVLRVLKVPRHVPPHYLFADKRQCGVFVVHHRERYHYRSSQSYIVLPTPVARGIIHKLLSYGGASAPPPSPKV